MEEQPESTFGALKIGDKFKIALIATKLPKFRVWDEAILIKGKPPKKEAWRIKLLRHLGLHRNFEIYELGGSDPIELTDRFSDKLLVLIVS